MDKIQIFGSPLGMYSLLREPYVISILRDDGTLDEKLLHETCRTIANQGANALRDFMWIDTAWAEQKIAPFCLVNTGTPSSPTMTTMWNDQYFEIQRQIAQACNAYNMRYYLCLFEHVGTKPKHNEWNPWRHFSDFFYGEDAKETRHEYIDRVLDAFHGLNVGVELCNEPKVDSAFFLADTFERLMQLGFVPENIIMGIDYYLKETYTKYGKCYRDFRLFTQPDNMNHKQWGAWLKSHLISTVHNADLDRIDDLWTEHGTIPINEVPKGGTRRVMYSMDGVRKFERRGEVIRHRPDRAYMEMVTSVILDIKSKARENDKILIEAVWGKEVTAPGIEPLNSIEGISEAYRNVWKEWPENYGKFPPVEQPPAPCPNEEETQPIEPPAQKKKIDILKIILLLAAILLLILAFSSNASAAAVGHYELTTPYGASYLSRILLHGYGNTVQVWRKLEGQNPEYITVGTWREIENDNGKILIFNIDNDIFTILMTAGARHCGSASIISYTYPDHFNSSDRRPIKTLVSVCIREKVFEGRKGS